MVKIICNKKVFESSYGPSKERCRKRLFTISSLFRSLKINSTSSGPLPSVTVELSGFWWCFMVWSRLQHKHTHIFPSWLFLWYLSTCRGCKGLLRCFYAWPTCVTHPMTSGNTETGRTREAVLANISLACAESTQVYRPPSDLWGGDPFPSAIAGPKQTKQMSRIRRKKLNLRY